MTSSTYNHDSFFKDIFGEPEQAAGLLRFALPPEVLSTLDLTGIRRLPEEHTANLGAAGRADLLYEVPCIGGEPIIISIFEHKSSPDNRVLSQIAQYWANIVLSDQPSPVLALLVYHGKRPWQPLGFRELFHDLPEPLRAYQPEFPFVFIDLYRQRQDEIWQNPLLDPETKLGLMVLRQIFDNHSGEDLDRLVDLLARSSQERRQRLIRAVWLYLINKGNISKARVEESMDRLPEADFVPHRTPRQEYLEEGMEQEKIEVIEGLLAKSCDWVFIEDITHLNEAAYQALKAKYQN